MLTPLDWWHRRGCGPASTAWPILVFPGGRNATRWFSFLIGSVVLNVRSFVQEGVYMTSRAIVGPLSIPSSVRPTHLSTIQFRSSNQYLYRQPQSFFNMSSGKAYDEHSSDDDSHLQPARNRQKENVKTRLPTKEGHTFWSGAWERAKKDFPKCANLPIMTTRTRHVINVEQDVD
ncbi:hypothetical protein HBI56_235070 [Parastagonospora nodorum]|uniref:Uncharacterized protein n=1 Tax=Phaeosphaeria nodorum (strain SN15 / ATCC MYA-4574 / FGSC 10173) TaxID=321614 RepID=A0A7U2EZJ4_PHANO|nr:hypothetical protein HBH56_227740 [Parastagonospora nodorum]QRC95766.1 hypothetical protein JI435_159190 [Parastagonospora nodorum SN15]KAH3921710.1 hypothetical protein HBH54_235040 [Parastagonospora nodorum]KAH3959104.1 hypothetical protein HBH51_203550 [Parastagonospora nodorum]KAH3963584.1 hypothetical protein HBH52_217870 [Parastagonospora nodorum]